MMTLLRKHRQWLMIVIAILVVPFCLYFVKTDYTALGNTHDQFARVYGRDVTMVEAQRGARLFNLAKELGMQNLVQSLVLGANSENEVYSLFTLNRLILRHEAERLGIRPTSTEIADFVRTLRPFLGPTGFDSKKYDELTQNVLPSMGFSEAQIEELATDELTLNRIKQLVTTGITVSDVETKNAYQQRYGMLFVDVIRLRASDFTKDIKVSDEDVQKYYESHKEALKTDETRKVDFVTLSMTDAQKKLSGKERIDALQKLADRANDFTQALLEKGAEFHQVAAKFQLPVELTAAFTSASPDPKLKADPSLAAAAFQLTAADPNSDVAQVGDSFYVLHLAEAVAARPLSLEEAKPKLVDTIKASRARERATTKGAQVAQEVRETLAAGAPLSFALEKANAKGEKLEPFILADDLDSDEAAKKPEKPEKPEKVEKRPADFIAVKNAAANLQPGDVSDFMPWEDGGIVVVLEKRDPPDESKLAQKKSTFDDLLLTNKREVVFFEWLQDRQREAGIIATTKS